MNGLKMKESNDDIFYNRYATIDDEDWIEIIFQSISEPIIDGIRFPGFPDSAIQSAMVGSSGETALKGARKFYLEMKRYIKKLDIELGEDTNILDFGCGFGRHIRFFLKDVPSRGLVGVDIDDKFITICQNTFPVGNFQTNPRYPPINFCDNHFSLVYAFSVFSHLSEDIGLAWIDEFARLLRPGGALMVTTHSRQFIDFCASLQGNTSFEHPWYEKLAANKVFADASQAHQDYEAGRFLFGVTGGGGVRTADIYGEAVLSREYIQSHWLEKFKLIDFFDDRSRLPQAMIVLQRK